MSKITRRTALELLAAAPAAAAFTWTPAQAEQAHTHAADARAKAAAGATRYKPKFLTAQEYATVAVLVDLIIPRDDRSGSATEAGVPEFIDFMMIDQPRRQVAMRGGLALVDRLSRERVGKSFVQSTDAQRRQLLDDLAYTAPGRRSSPPSPSSEVGKASAGRLPQAIAFFSSFRDLTATGFFTSKMGIADLEYRGNVFVSEWNGCPEDALRKLGV